ncbi:unnamed protein product [Rotaria magnacalcarata]
MPKTFNITNHNVLIHSNNANYNINREDSVNFNKIKQTNDNVHDFEIIKSIVKKIVSRVCRLDNERKRQLQNRKKTQKFKNIVMNESVSLIVPIESNTLDETDFHDALLRKQSSEFSKKYYRNKYENNKDFREKENARTRSYNNLEYNTNSNFRSKTKEKSKKNFISKYRNSIDFRNKFKTQSKINKFNKYHDNSNFRDKVKTQSKITILNKYHNNSNFRDKVKTQSKITILNKYHSNSNFRNKYKARTKSQVLKKYYTNHAIRLKMIQSALNSYHRNKTLTIQKSRQLYNQRRRILKKYSNIESHKCIIKHSNLYIDKLKEFRKIIQEGPDYICISCGLALFRNQVIPFVKQKYSKEGILSQIEKHIQVNFNNNSSMQQQWICRLCSDKMKKQQLPARAISNKLEVCQTPCELKRLNNLEKHLIALRLPFMKIVNLTSGKLSSRLAQKGTKGPLHCVPSDVQETVTTLPRPVDKSMMVRLQLKRRLKYKAIWEEQLINPTDVRHALLILTKINPAYNNIKIKEIDQSYLTSDQQNNDQTNTDSAIEIMHANISEKENLPEEISISEENHIKSLALGDINNNDNSDEEIDEDNNDARTKYNIGTDSCIQPCDYHDFILFDKEPSIVAPAEKN